MSNFDLVREELRRRGFLAETIRDYISVQFPPKPGLILRRGAVQNEIGKALGVTVNNLVRALVNEQMRQVGYRLVTIDGYQVYRH